MTVAPGSWSSQARAGSVAALDGLYAHAEQGHGHTVFVVGDDQVGRSGLVRAWAAGVAERPRHARVVGGTFSEGHYEPWPADATAAAHALERLASALQRAGVAADVLDLALPGMALLLGQLLSLSEDAVQVACRCLRASKPADRATRCWGAC